jgi:hypothetical protein
MNTQKEDQRRKKQRQKIQTDRANIKNLKERQQKNQSKLPFEMQVSSAA